MKINNTDIQNASLQELKELRDFINTEIDKRDTRKQIQKAYNDLDWTIRTFVLTEPKCESKKARELVEKLRDLCAWIRDSEEQS